MNYDQLVLQPSTLSYGLYKLVFQVSMTFSSIYTSQVFSYILVKPSGLIIMSVYGSTGGGTYQMALGLSQTLKLDPRSFSDDLDNLVNFNSLNFTFKCRVIDAGVTYGYPQLFYNDDLDLYKIATNYQSSSNIQALFNPNNTQHSCFSSISKHHWETLELSVCLNPTLLSLLLIKDQFSFDATGGVLTVAPGGLSYVSNRVYEFYTETSYYGTSYYQYVQILIQPVNYVPLLTLS